LESQLGINIILVVNKGPLDPAHPINLSPKEALEVRTETEAAEENNPNMTLMFNGIPTFEEIGEPKDCIQDPDPF
jgi:hypothetical protein